jgi:hypothetical protein
VKNPENSTLVAGFFTPPRERALLFARGYVQDDTLFFSLTISPPCDNIFAVPFNKGGKMSKSVYAIILEVSNDYSMEKTMIAFNEGEPVWIKRSKRVLKLKPGDQVIKRIDDEGCIFALDKIRKVSSFKIKKKEANCRKRKKH